MIHYIHEGHWIQSNGDQTLFNEHISFGELESLIICVDVLIINSNDTQEVKKLGKKLFRKLKIKGLRRLK